MSALSAKETQRNLCKKGFRQEEGDHHFLYFYYNGKREAIKTKISHNMSDLDDYLISAMARQIKLSKIDFIAFAKCRMSEEEYIMQLVKDKLLN